MFESTSNNVSRKRRATVLEEMEHEFQDGRLGVRRTAGWSTQSIENWSKHVRHLRQRSCDQELKRKFDKDDSREDPLYEHKKRFLT